MYINDVQFNVELEQILDDLKKNTGFFTRGFKESGGDIMCQCPFHANGQERRPSAGIRKSDGVFHCFACGETRTLPEVITYCFGNDPDTSNYGWRWLLRNYGTVSVEERDDLDLDFVRNQVTGIYRTNSNSMVTGNVGDYNTHTGSGSYVSESELDSYRYTHPYMYKRKLTDEVIEIFDIGYDSSTDCITFPVRDISGACLFVARRSVKTKYFNYPSGVEKPVYGLYELYQLDRFPSEIIVCESMLDALTCWVYGKYAVALNGLGNDLQFKQLQELPCRKLILATDNDDAGMKARKRIRKNLYNKKIITEYVFPNNRKDINELSKEEFDNLTEVF